MRAGIIALVDQVRRLREAQAQAAQAARSAAAQLAGRIPGREPAATLHVGARVRTVAQDAIRGRTGAAVARPGDRGGGQAAHRHPENPCR